MRAGTTVFAKMSFRRAGTCPVPFGRPFAMAGCVSGAFSRLAWPLPAGCLPPPAGGLGAGFASAFAMALAPVDRLAAAAAGADPAALGEDLDPPAPRLVTAGADDEAVGEGPPPPPLDDAALPELLRPPPVPPDQVDV